MNGWSFLRSTQAAVVSSSRTPTREVAARQERRPNRYGTSVTLPHRQIIGEEPDRGADTVEAKAVSCAVGLRDATCGARNW